MINMVYYRFHLLDVHTYTCIEYLSSDSFLWREVEDASVGQISLNLLVELSELGILSIHIPLLHLHTNEHLRVHRLRR